MRAEAILQDYLDILADAVLRDDWETYASRVRLPFQLITERAAIQVLGEDELQDGFDAFVDMIRSQRVTHYVRTVTSAAQLSATAISGTYTTEILADGKRVVQPFQSRIIVRLRDGIWQATSISNNIMNPRWPVLLPVVGEAD